MSPATTSKRSGDATRPASNAPLTGALARRFHFGDPTVPVPELPEGLIPLALAGFRGVRARPGWPLVVEPGAGREAFARPLGPALAEFARAAGDPRLAEALGRVEESLDRRLASGEPQALQPSLVAAAERVAEATGTDAAGRDRLLALVTTFAGLSSPEALLVGWGEAAPWRLADLAARRRLAALRPEARRALTALAAEADGLLAADAERRPDGTAPAARESRLGALGSRFLDPGRLLEVTTHRRGSPPLEEGRRAALIVARDRLRAALEENAEPLWATSFGSDDLPAGLRGRRAEDACAEACRRFDAAAARVAEVARAARRVRLELAGELDERVHGPGLERLDWRDFDAEELALVPPVFAVARPLELLASGAQSLLRLFLSGRPIQVIVPVGGDEAADLATFDPAALGLGHRNVIVHRASPGRSERMVEGLARALASGLPALHLLDLPSPVPGLDPWVVAAARVGGRATPLIFHDPAAGGAWARRLRLDGNPALRADWPVDPVASTDGAGSDGAVPFTFADAALLDPAWRRHFAPVAGDEAAWTPVGEWLDQPAERASHLLPGVEGIDSGGVTRRLAISRSLALATRRRRDEWRSLEELAGVRSERLDETAAAVRNELAESAARDREALEAAHAEALERIRAEASAVAVGRIVAGLMGEGPLALADLAAGAPPAADGTTPSPASASATSSTGPSAEEAAPAPPAADAWVDTALCTSCDECVRKYPSIFVYDGNKQATIKDPRGGSFRDLVRAAEACPARVIHPGEPWNAGEKDLAAWVERARKFD